MKAASSAALPRPPSGWTKSSCPAGGSPRSAKTFSMPASAIRSRVPPRPSAVSPTQLRCAMTSKPTSSRSALVISTVPSRVDPPAPYVTDTKSGSSSRSDLAVANRASTWAGSRGGKNSTEKTGRLRASISSIRIWRRVPRRPPGAEKSPAGNLKRGAVPPVPETGSSPALALVAAGAVFFAALAQRAIRTYVLTRRRADLAVVPGTVWLGVALVPQLTMEPWSWGWWFGHALEFAGIALVGGAVALDLYRTSPSRPLAGDLRGAELVAAEEAFFGSRVRALMVRLAVKDGYTEGHTRRVALRAVQVGERLGLSPWRLRNLAIGGLLHDMGKLAVPDAILQKPGPLDDREYAVIRRHPAWGEQLLVELGGFPSEVPRQQPALLGRRGLGRRGSRPPGSGSQELGGGGVVAELGGAGELGRGLGATAKALEELAPCRRQQVVAVERGLVVQPSQQIEAGDRPECHAHRDSAVESDDRGAGDRFERVVQSDDPLPVGALRRACPGVTGGDGGL